MKSTLVVLATLLLSGCNDLQPRVWTHRDRPLPTSAVPGVGTLTFLEIKNREDYLWIKATLTNEGSAPIGFGPREGSPWGLTMVPQDKAIVSGRVEGSPEMMYVPPGGVALVECLWRIYPAAPTSDWGWSLRFDGLMADGKPLDGITVSMPVYEPPDIERGERKHGY